MLKIGILGCGKITEVRHAPEYAENPDCELVAFYDFLPERAQKWPPSMAARCMKAWTRCLTAAWTR